MATTHSFGFLIGALATLGLGIFTQQPVIVGAGAGVAGSISSANIVRFRRKNEQNINSERNNTHIAKRLQSLESTVGNLGTQAALTESIISQLERTSKTQATNLNLQTKGIQKLQQVNYSHRSTIAAQTVALDNKDREIAYFQTELDEIYHLVCDRQPVRAPITPVTHLLIDGNAMRFITKEIGNIDYAALRNILTAGAKEVKSKFYLGDAKTTGQIQFIKALENRGFDVIRFPIINLQDEEHKQKTKGDDVQIAIDAVSALPGDRVILCGGGDSDFFPVIDRLKAKGIDFTVVAHQSTLGDRLRRSAGKNIIYFSAIDGIKLS